MSRVWKRCRNRRNLVLNVVLFQKTAEAQGLAAALRIFAHDGPVPESLLGLG